MSDLHLESRRNELESRLLSIIEGSKQDILIIAGDFHTPLDSDEKETEFITALKLCKNQFEHVIYVAGNHDYWQLRRNTSVGLTYEQRTAKLQQLVSSVPGCVMLCENYPVHVINGQRFVGTTLWTNISENDFHILRDSVNLWKDRDEALSTHNRNVEILKSNIKDGDVVITHHPPSLSVQHESFKKYGMESAFYNMLDDLVKEKRPHRWFCGHSHKQKTDVVVGWTMLSMHPYGYPGENTGFTVGRYCSCQKSAVCHGELTADPEFDALVRCI